MADTRALPSIKISADPRAISRALCVTFALGACAYLVVQLFGVASRLAIEYYDGYQNLVNARALATGAPAFYSYFRPLGLTLLYSPLHAIDARAWQSVHQLAVLVYAALGVTALLLFRHAMSLPFAAAATLVLMWNPLALHYAPFALADLPATLFLAASLLFHLRRNFAAECLAVCAAAAVRYPLLAFLPIFYAGSHWARGDRTRAALALVMPPLGLFVLSILVHLALGRPPFSFPAELLAQYRYNGQNGARPAAYALWFAARLLPPVLLIAAAIGVKRHARIFLFIAGFLVVNALLVPGKEARYFLPLLPPLTLLVGVGTERLWNALPRVARLYLLALLAVPLAAGTRELARFSDPVYTDDFVDRVATALEARSPTGNLYWIGPFYPLHPTEFVDTRVDDYTHLHHISADAILWRLNRPVRGLSVDLVSRVVRDGDAVVVNHEPEGYVTRTLPTRKLRPVVVEAMRGGKFTDAIVIAPR